MLAFVNALTLALGAASLLSYVLAYTPLKRVTSLCTVVGAVPGALPPLMGWAAARGSLGAAGWGLFAILFLWQLPHFLAIGWLYREDYARGGFPMLAVTDKDGASTGRQAVLYATALLPVTLAAGLLASAGAGYLWGALVLGLAFLGVRRGCSPGSARSEPRGGCSSPRCSTCRSCSGSWCSTDERDRARRPPRTAGSCGCWSPRASGCSSGRFSSSFRGRTEGGTMATEGHSDTHRSPTTWRSSGGFWA